MSANEEVDGTRFDVGIEFGEGFGFEIVAVKTSELGLGKEFLEFGGKKLGAEAFMKEIGLVTLRTEAGDGRGVAAEVADEGISVGVESEGEIAMRAESLPTAVSTESERGGATAVVEDESLMVLGEVTLDGGEKRLGEIAVFDEETAILKVNDGGDRRLSGVFSLMIKLNEGRFLAREVIINDIGGGGAEDARDFEGVGDVAGETQGGVTGRVFLIVGGFVGFVD